MVHVLSAEDSTYRAMDLVLSTANSNYFMIHMIFTEDSIYVFYVLSTVLMCTIPQKAIYMHFIPLAACIWNSFVNNITIL